MPPRSSKRKKTGGFTNSQSRKFASTMAGQQPPSKRKARLAAQRTDSVESSSQDQDWQDEYDDEGDHGDGKGKGVQQHPPPQMHDPHSRLKDVMRAGQGLGQDIDPVELLLARLLGPQPGPQPGGPGSAAGSNAGSLLSTLALLGGGGIPGIGGPMPGSGMPQRMGPPLQAPRAPAAGMGPRAMSIPEPIAEEEDREEGSSKGKGKGKQREEPPDDSQPVNMEAHPLPASILEMMDIVHLLRDSLKTQIIVESNLVRRIQKITDAPEPPEDDNPLQHILQFHIDLQEVRKLTDKQLNILESFAQRAEPIIAEMQMKNELRASLQG